MMRILIYGYEYPPIGGGVGNALKNLFQEFEKDSNFQIDFITTSLEGKTYTERKFKNITFHYLNLGDRQNKLHSQKSIDLIKFTFKSFLYTWKLIFKNKYDLSVAFGFPGGFVPMLFRWRMKYIVSLRGVDVPGYNDRFKKWYIIYKPLNFFVWQFASKVIANSEGLKELAKQTNKYKEIEIIPNGIDINKFKSSKNKFTAFTVTAGGTLLGKLKGLNYLVEGFAQFSKDKENVSLLLIGSGDEETNLKNLATTLGIKQRVKFVGRKSNDWIAENLPKCHVYCLPSLNEGMSNSALEALASGLPLLLTETGGTKEILYENMNGFLIKKHDAKDISDKLNKIFNDPNLTLKMGKESRKIAKDLSWENTGNKYIKVFNSVRNIS